MSADEKPQMRTRKSSARSARSRRIGVTFVIHERRSDSPKRDDPPDAEAIEESCGRNRNACFRTLTCECSIDRH